MRHLHNRASTAPRLRPLIPVGMAERIRVLAAESQVTGDHWVIAALEHYIMEHRTTRPFKVDPSHYHDRAAEECDT